MGMSTGAHAYEPRRKSHVGRTVALVILVVVLVLACGAAFVGVRLSGSVQTAKAQASQLVSDARALQADVGTAGAASIGDALSSGADELSDDLAALRQTIGTPEWTLASNLPVYGADVSAARSLVDLGEDLVTDVLKPAAQTLQDHPLKDAFVNGSMDGASVSAYCDLVTAITPRVSQLADRASALSAPHVTQVNEAIQEVSDALSKASDALDDYEPLVAQVPDLIGSNGARTYLVVAQTNSEIRSTGGMPGAQIVVTLDNGALSIGGVYSGGDFVGTTDAAEAIPLTDEETAIFGPYPGEVIQNVNYVYDFPRVADLLNQYWQRDHGMTFDGVIAVDPFFLQDVVRLIGNIDMPDGSVLTGDTTAQTLLNGVYLAYPEDYDAQDEYFATAVGAVMDKIASISLSDVDASAFAQAVRDGIDAGHILAWMRDGEEEQVATQLGCDGAVGHDAANPQLGVYFVDVTYSKIDWYLGAQTTVGAGVPNGDGTVSYPVTTTLANVATDEEVAGLPSYVTGYNEAKRSLGDILTGVYIDVPEGGTISDLQADGDVSVWSGATLYGHQVAGADVHTDTGERATITYTITLPESANAPTVRQTPTVQAGKLS